MGGGAVSAPELSREVQSQILHLYCLFPSGPGLMTDKSSSAGSLNSASCFLSFVSTGPGFSALETTPLVWMARTRNVSADPLLKQHETTCRGDPRPRRCIAKPHGVKSITYASATANTHTRRQRGFASGCGPNSREAASSIPIVESITVTCVDVC